ncbi:hypothetical protein [Pedobacter mucosus]|uniref:hypothetical protein n=1 Tax=Pedobacter mucosus TaxID=2895286 RepID=UPI001EE40E84|nr:hypothetical protein [Pedobacter mucosus]UKT62769.1 hypothetical protein LOK61_13465 [Pedobacter mucosus]
MKNIFPFSVIVIFAVLACNDKKEVDILKPAPPLVETVDPPGAPPATWKEHWFEHVQLLNRVYYDTSVVIYYDGDVKSSIVWPKTYMAEAWNYTKKTYGKFGTDSRLYAIYHSGKYGGGHPSTYMDASHDFRNVTDCGSNDANAWITGTGNDIDLSTHEIGHIVEGAAKGIHSSPAFGIWHDSKWMEIYQYDVYLGLGRNDDALRWYDKMMATTDNFPKANTQWFKNWFYPIYNGYGKTKALNNFFTLLSKNFPQRTYNNGVTTYPEYSRGMNMGEFIHFWSGAAGTNLETLAVTAFGPKDEQGNAWAAQLIQAKKDFPNVTY